MRIFGLFFIVATCAYASDSVSQWNPDCDTSRPKGYIPGGGIAPNNADPPPFAYVDLKKLNISIVCLCPGRVKTRMGFGAEVEPEDSVSGMRERIDELTIGQTGRFVRFNGEVIPW